MAQPDPTDDERQGAAWWNTMTRRARRHWLAVAPAGPAEAWAVYKKMIRNQSAWRAGFAAGLDRDEDCPFPAGSVKALSWSDGWIEGFAKRRQRPAR